MSAFDPVWLSTLEILGWSLLHFLWQGCLIGGLYAIVRHQLPPARADLRYAAGLAALALMALCLPITAALLVSSEPVAVSAAAGGLGVMSVSGFVESGRFNIDALMPWLVTLWSLGVVVFAWRALREMRGYARIVAGAARSDVRIDAMLAQVAARVGYLGRVCVLISDRIDTPTLFGWIRPVILLPTAVALNFPRQQLELILAHELGHLRRYDHYTNLAQTVVETLLFYHPVVHWIARDVRHEREVCCDRLVLGLDQQASRDYVRTLAALQELRLQPSPLVLAATGGYLLDRVQRILLTPSERPLQPRSNAAYWVLLTVLIGGALLMTTRLREQREALEALTRSLLEKLPRPQALLLADLALDVSRDLAISAPVRSRVPLPAVLPDVVRPVDATVGAIALPEAVPQLTALAPERSLPGVAAPVTTLPTPSTVSTLPDTVEGIAPATNRAAKPPLPFLVRQVTPQYPDAVLGSSQGHVEFDFMLAADGSVQDIHVVSGDAQGRFASAARKALAQWKFAPVSVTAGARLRQDFVFRSGVAEATNSVGCKRGTGSHICPSARGPSARGR